MYREYNHYRETTNQSPHKRGDVPKVLSQMKSDLLISPQAWGCTADIAVEGRIYANLPTSVGMYRGLASASAVLQQSPHKRGDVPSAQILNHSQNGISPQAWGCTGFVPLLNATNSNLPTSVGMYLSPGRSHGQVR